MKYNQTVMSTMTNGNSTVMVANSVSHILAKITGQSCHAHDVEEDSFELSLDGEKYAGGSYYIDEDNSLVLASVTPQQTLGNINNLKEIEENLR